ncbi:MAG: hypothetical protein RL748_539 [Pseudomonadota bacterium]|jgi:hypothetical protein
MKSTKPPINKKLPKDQIRAEAANIAQPTPLETKIFSLLRAEKHGGRQSVHHENPYVVLKYFQADWEYFSDWTQDELKQFSSFLTTFGQHTWDSVYKSGGKGGQKAGLGYTPYQIADMKNGKSHLEKVSRVLAEDIGFFELRISQKIRVHGFQAQAAFFLVLLDRGHRVFPG